MSSPLASFKKALASAVTRSQGLSDDDALDLERQLRAPAAEHGDLSLPCFGLAKRLKKNPAELAAEIAATLSGDPRWASVEVVGPYVNVSYSGTLLTETVVPMARAEGYGSSQAGAGKTVVIDFSSPNIAKPLAFHHIRSTVIGAAIGRLHAACGWKVAGINYLGDWGKQFGLLATGFARYGDPTKRADAKHLVEVYVRSNQEADVGARKAAIAAPEAARALVSELVSARTSLASASADDGKKLEKQVKGLEKKLRAQRGLDDPEADPAEGANDWFAQLEAAKAQAEAELPGVEARDSEARSFLKRMEDGDEAALAEWKEFRDTSIAEFQRIYRRMEIEFTSLEGESHYQHGLEQTLERVRNKPGTTIDDGAEIVSMPSKKGEPPAMVRTRDGTTLYLTRDIAAAMDRHARFNFDRALYVVAADQSLHFDQLFRTLGAMGFAWSKNMMHVAFGRVQGMSTRRGAVVFLDEVLEESVTKARTICEQSEKIAPEHLDEAVEAIGVGAIVFGDLRNLRTSDYQFSWDEVLNFTGHTAPYVQFSHARACSIIRKGGGVPDQADLSKLVLPEERAVIMALARFPESVQDACDAYEPSLVTRALIDVAQTTAAYLTAGNRDRAQRVLVEDDPETQAARLFLVDAIRATLATGLALLGVRAPEAM